MSKPVETEYNKFYATYINAVEEDDLQMLFSNGSYLYTDFFRSIPGDKHDYAYAPGKWTMKEVLQHIIDCERIFAYRALCLSRKEAQSLPGFDENVYADQSNAKSRSWNDLCDELVCVRKSTGFLFGSLTEEVLQLAGMVNNNYITVKAIGFIILGHLEHHIRIIEERYL